MKKPVKSAKRNVEKSEKYPVNIIRYAQPRVKDKK